MKILGVRFFKVGSCGGLLDDLDIALRDFEEVQPGFDPICLVGANGAGKSQFLQALAEAFQVVFQECVPSEERGKVSSDLQFQVEYLIRATGSSYPEQIRITRKGEGRKRPVLVIERKVKENEWMLCPLDAPDTPPLLPSKIIGYSSGDNETMSLPFLVSRSAYADSVSRQALSTAEGADTPVPETRLMLIDYGTHLEILVANLLLGSPDLASSILSEAGLRDLHSFRCIIQLGHSAVPRGVKLTKELELNIDRLRRSSTCYSFDEKTNSHVLDFLVDEEARSAFRFFWETGLTLYSTFHKISMLNDLAIPKPARTRFRREIVARRFAARLPEPQDEDRVFRFEQVRFRSLLADQVVDYVSLSDGEHQLAQIMGTLGMISERNVLMLLDEPESHFNPQWRVKFIAKMLDIRTANGKRSDESSEASQQDCFLTTHAPFVPSDMARTNVLIFGKSGPTLEVRRPQLETFGSTFDTILKDCFDVSPPMSELPRREIKMLMKSDDPEIVKAGLSQLGPSIDKAFLVDHLQQLTEPL
jgi:restriction system-associated AAA family ATPase